MLDVQTASRVIDHGLSLGSDFVDLFVEKNVVSSINYIDSRVKDVRSGTDFGIGIRAIFGNKSVYGYANSMEVESLLSIMDTICSLDRKESLISHEGVAIKDQTRASSQIQVKQGLDQFQELEAKIDFLKAIDAACRQNKLIAQVDISATQRWQQVEIFDSEGLHHSEDRHYTRIANSAIAQDGNDQARAFHGPGASRGWEYTEELDPHQIADLICRRALTVLRAEACPAGQMPVIIDNGFGGVIFHEACGHLLETTSVEKKASVFHDKMGEMIAHSAVSAADDGTLTGYWGSLQTDDEGMPTQRTQLIKDGKLVNFLVDRLGARKTGYPRSGSGRRQSYKFPPASRMRNTYIEPGPHSFDELISSVDRGLYAKVMGGGSVTPGTGDFNFAVEEAYLIESGQIGKAVRGATLIGSGPETLKNISMVGSNFALSPGMCGSVSGNIPVTVGQPALKVDSILIGGEKA